MKENLEEMNKRVQLSVILGEPLTEFVEQDLRPSTKAGFFTPGCLQRPPVMEELTQKAPIPSRRKEGGQGWARRVGEPNGAPPMRPALPPLRR